MSRVPYPASPWARWFDLEKAHHVITTQLVHWRADFYVATSYNIRPLRHSFHCCELERVYGAVAWQCIDEIRYSDTQIKKNLGLFEELLKVHCLLEATSTKCVAHEHSGSRKGSSLRLMLRSQW
jgi:hypothetical protein